MKVFLASLLVAAVLVIGFTPLRTQAIKYLVKPFEDQAHRLMMGYLKSTGAIAYAFPSVTDIVATTIESRSKKVADNVENNNAGIAYIKKNGNVKTVSGGSEILEEISFSENGNAGWYSGYDLLPVAAQDVLSAARFNLKQAAVPVVISGLEQLQNAGREQQIELMDSRLTVAESTMANLISQGFYSDGTGSGGKTIVGLDAAVPVDASPTNNRVDAGTYGSIDRATWSFWRPVYYNPGAITLSNIQGYMNFVWSLLIRGRDAPDVIISDQFMWQAYMASLQAQQRFVDVKTADLGFPSVKFMNTDVVLDGGLYFPSTSYGSGVTTKTMFFLNTKFLKWRPHSARNMVPLSPNRRYAINQDAEVAILAWAGAMTCNGQAFHGRLVSN